MQLATENVSSSSLPASNFGAQTPSSATGVSYADYKIIRRNGAVVAFEPAKIAIAMTKAFIAVNGGQARGFGARCASMVEALTRQVVNALMRRQPHGGTFHIEDIQDQVELALMRSGEHEVARAYVLYREKRTQERAKAEAAAAGAAEHRTCHVIENGAARPLDMAHADRPGGRLPARAWASRSTPQPILQATLRDLYDGVPMDEVRKCADPVRALADRKGPGLQLRHRAPAAQHHPPRSAGRGSAARRDMAHALCRIFPRLHQAGHRSRAAGRAAGAVRPAAPGRGARRRRATCSSTTSACKPCMTAISCTSTSAASNCRRPSSCAWRWAWRSTRSTAKRAPSSSTTCCPASTS